jgi:hemerythrin superfamily protein
MKSERYISELKSGHERIKGLFRLLRELIDTEGEPDSGAVIQALRELREVLISHVRDEDENFYPAIRQRAIERGQDAFLPAIDLCSESMHLINRESGNFFERFKTEQDVLRYREEFKEKIEQIIEVVEERIKSEEGSLFPLYRAYCSRE